jgi:diguanylate cyclase (GGDEF)-like protein/PAS domain S-box-containing protein
MKIPGTRLQHSSAPWLIALLAVFSIGHYLLPLSSAARLWWADSFWTAAALLAAIRCHATARHHTGHRRHAWQLFALGCLAWFGGMLVWDYMELVAGRVTPFPAPSDFGYLLFAPFFSAGLLLYRTESPGTSFRLLDLSQLGVFVACIVIIHIVLFYQSALDLKQPTLYLVTALAYPVLYMALLVQAVAYLWTTPPGTARRALSFVVAGIAVHAATDSLYAYALLGHEYATGHYLDAAWIAGFALIYHGAAREAATVEYATAVNAHGYLPRSLHLSRLLAPLALLGTLAVVLLFRHMITPMMTDELLAAVLVLFAFLALREWTSGALQEQLNVAIRASEEELRKVTRLVPVGIFRTDVAGDCAYVNEYWCALTGLTPPQAYGMGWADALHPQDRESVFAAWRDAVNRKNVFRSEYRFQRPDGQVAWVVGEAHPEYDEYGTLSGYVGSITDITARKEAEQALRDSEERFRKTFHASPVIISITRVRDDRFIDVNETFEEVFGWRRDETIGHTSLELNLWISPLERAKAVERLEQDGTIQGMDLSVRARSGQIRHCLCSIERLSIGGEDCMLAVLQDVTDRIRAEVERDKLSRAIGQTADAVMITDRDGLIEYVNPAFEATTGFSAGEVLGKKPNILKSGAQGKDFYRNLWKTILGGGSFNEVFVNRKKNGSLYYEEKTITPLKDASGQITHFVATGRDISERMQSQVQLEYMAHHDALTDLPNRTLFLDRLKQALARARWHKRLAAVLFIDIDRFKNINDTLGHEVGDKLLQELSRRLQPCLRDGDTVARFGGDEFVILLDDLAAATDVRNLAGKILDQLRPPFQAGESSLYVTASIGISLFPADGEDSSSLLRNADTAMYRAKDLGRNNYQFYSAEMSARAFERLTLENNLRRALERHEFLLYYQPQLNTQTGEVVGVEALLRWQHPDFGMVLPAEFVPLLEDTGLILPVGRWVLQEACRQLAEWHGQGWAGLRMAVNLSSRQFSDETLLATVESELKRHNLRPDLLDIEITESTILQHRGGARHMLESLRRLGVQIALDDFGTGYSSLSHVQNFDIDTLKIDRSFVMDIPGDAIDTAITEAIIALGKGLKLNLIAEGVETEVQRDFLQALGCHVMQGYLFSRPQPAVEIPEILSRHRRPAA